MPVIVVYQRPELWTCIGDTTTLPMGLPGGVADLGQSVAADDNGDNSRPLLEELWNGALSLDQHSDMRRRWTALPSARSGQDHYGARPKLWFLSLGAKIFLSVGS